MFNIIAGIVIGILGVCLLEFGLKISPWYSSFKGAAIFISFIFVCNGLVSLLMHVL